MLLATTTNNAIKPNLWTSMNRRNLQRTQG
uniref:Uncharacterized protein n=1 Tax=Arundo donax TaxID=35708 RepID=A0A0A9APF8_ARUDO